MGSHFDSRFFWVRTLSELSTKTTRSQNVSINWRSGYVCLCWMSVGCLRNDGDGERERERERERVWLQLDHGIAKFVMTWSMDVCFIMLCFTLNSWWQNSLGSCVQGAFCLHKNNLETRNHSALPWSKTLSPSNADDFTCRMSRMPRRSRKKIPVTLGAAMRWRCRCGGSTGDPKLKALLEASAAGRRGTACAYSCPGEPMQHITETWSWSGKPPDLDLFTPF